MCKLKMIYFKLIILITLQIHNAQLLSPVGLKALAVAHNQRARAIANALNLKARARYNAFARTKNNLGFDRFIRQLNQDFSSENEFNINNIEDSQIVKFLASVSEEKSRIQDIDGIDSDKDGSLENGDIQNLDQDLVATQRSSDDKYLDIEGNYKLNGNLLLLPLNYDSFLGPEEIIFPLDDVYNKEFIEPNQNYNFDRENGDFRQTDDIKLDDSDDTTRTAESPLPIINAFIPTFTKAFQPHNLPRINLSPPTYYYNQNNYPEEERLSPEISGNPFIQQNYEFGKEKSADPHIKFHVHPHEHIYVHDIGPSKQEKIIQPALNIFVIPSAHNTGQYDFTSVYGLNPKNLHVTPQQEHMHSEPGPQTINLHQTVNMHPTTHTTDSPTFIHEKVGEPFHSAGELVALKPKISKPNIHNEDLGTFKLITNLKQSNPKMEISPPYKMPEIYMDEDIKVPEFPYFESNQLQNPQSILEYIKSFQDHEKPIFPFAEELYDGDNYKFYPINKNIDLNSLNNDQFQHYKIEYISKPNMEIDEVQTINMGDIGLNSVPEFERETLIHYLDFKPHNIDDIFEHINDPCHHDMNALGDITDTDYYSDTPEVHYEFEPQNYVEINDDGINNERNAKIKHKKDETENTEMLVKFLENDSNFHPVDNYKLGYIIQIPERQYFDKYLRKVRSLNKNEINKTNKLSENKSVTNFFKNNISNNILLKIGSTATNLYENLHKRIKKANRIKRETWETPQFRKLFTDPKTQLNIPKTLDNLGTVTRNAFESEKAPMYHVRNMAGSAQNAMLAALKIPTKNFLIPSDYDIVYTKQRNENVNAINPTLFSRSGGQNGGERTIPMHIQGSDVLDTFQKVGSAIRDGIMSGQEALYHAGDVVNHAKDAIHTSKDVTPRLILNQIPAVVGEPKKQTFLITPRIFDITDEENKVSSTFLNPQPDLIKVGHILDAVGISNPNPNPLHIEKFLIEPRSMFPTTNHFIPIMSNTRTALKKILNDIRNVNVNNKLIGNTLKNLQDARQSIGAINLKDLIIKMKQRLQPMLRSNIFDGRTENYENNETGQNKNRPNAILDAIKQAYFLQKPHKVSDYAESHNKVNTIVEANLIQNKNVVTHIPKQEQQFLPHTNGERGITNLENNMSKLINDPLKLPFINHMSGSEFDTPGNNKKIVQQIPSNQKYPINFNIESEETPLNNKKQNRNESDKNQLLGGINPIMFQNLFNETLTLNDVSNSHSIYHDHYSEEDLHQNDNTEEQQVGVIMDLTEQMLTPFMGQARTQDKVDFFKTYMLNNVEDENYSVKNTENSNYPIKTHWNEIIQPEQQYIAEER